MITLSEPFNPPDGSVLSKAAGIIEDLSACFPSVQAGHFVKYMSGHIDRFCLDFEIIKRHQPPPALLLDVGAVPPVLSTLLSHSGYQVYGVDIDPDRMLRSASDLSIKKCNVEINPLPFEENTFDGIILFEIFEHLRVDITFTLSEIKRVLKKNGNLFVSTPNLRSLLGLYNFLVKGQSFSCLPGLYPAYQSIREKGHAGHIREYTKRELVEFLSSAGFDVTTIINRGRYSDNAKQMIARLFPSSRPFFTVIATPVK